MATIRSETAGAANTGGVEQMGLHPSLYADPMLPSRQGYTLDDYCDLLEAGAREDRRRIAALEAGLLRLVLLADADDPDLSYATRDVVWSLMPETRHE